ncbi:hypothetical protein [Streptomyces pseudogriseolus]|uniref:hypothetical protein n=1 Tax=Streptomyces pseudogriseolus TaxID=36817 RepID=UPI003FA31AC7
MSELFDAVDAVDARLASRAALPPPAERERLRAAHGLKIDEVATALKVLATAQKMRRATVSGRENGKTEPRPPERDAHAAAGQARGALPSRRRCRAGAAPAPAEAQTSSTGQASEAADALNPLHGDQVRRLHTALRSFFGALKRERLIFRDPARTISLTSNRSVPTGRAALRPHRRPPRPSGRPPRPPHGGPRRHLRPDPPISTGAVQQLLQRADLPAGRLGVDRIVDEARHSADPVRLMQLFGLSNLSATRHVLSAHPDKKKGPVAP